MISLSRTKTSPLVAVFTAWLSAFMILSAACAKRSRTIVPPPKSPPAIATRQTSAIKLININTASAKELEELPGIGQGLAERILEHREKYGLFRRPEHLMMVRGISDARFRALRHLITVDR